MHYKLVNVIKGVLILTAWEREIGLSIIAEKTQQKCKNTWWNTYQANATH